MQPQIWEPKTAPFFTVFGSGSVDYQRLTSIWAVLRCFRWNRDLPGPSPPVDGGTGEIKALDEAIEHFHEGLKIDPKSAMTHYNLARALAKRGDIEEALAQYRTALQINPADPDIHNNLGLLLVRRGSIDEAAQQFIEAARVNPDYAKAYFNLGKVLAQQRRPTERYSG